MSLIWDESWAFSTLFADYQTYGLVILSAQNARIQTGGPLGDNYLELFAGTSNVPFAVVPLPLPVQTFFYGQRQSIAAAASGSGPYFTLAFLSENSLLQFLLKFDTASQRVKAYSGAVIGTTIIDGGAGYVSAPSVSFSGAAGATGTATVSGGAITGITITNPGHGATDGNAVNLSGGSPSRGANITYTTLLGQSAVGAFPVGGNWHYLEVGGVIDATGNVQVKVGAGPGSGTVQVLNVHGNTNADTASGKVGQIRWDNDQTATGAGPYRVTHHYLNDQSGNAPWNTFLGDVRVFNLEAVANDSVQFTPTGAGANWQNAIVVPPAPVANFNGDSNIGEQDTYVIAAIPPQIGAVYGVATVVLLGKDSSGARSGASILKSGSTVQVNTSRSLTTTSQAFRDLTALDPNTGLAWLVANMTAGKIKVGVRVTA